MSEISISGTITEVLELKSGKGAKSGKEWKIQSYVLETPGQYPKHVVFDVWGDNISKFNIEKGKYYNVSIDIDANERNGRWFNSIKAWKIEEATPDSATAEATAIPAAEQPVAEFDEPKDDGDLPF